MAMSFASTQGEPVMEINTTPLIDVMLVLLIMFIITIPVQTHAVKLDTPGPVPQDRFLQPTTNEVEIDDRDAVSWNGAPINLIVLRQYLDQTQRMDPIPELHVRPAADARYDVVDNVLAVTKRAHVANMGFVGNEAYANF